MICMEPTDPECVKLTCCDKEWHRDCLTHWWGTLRTHVNLTCPCRCSDLTADIEKVVVAIEDANDAVPAIEEEKKEKPVDKQDEEVKDGPKPNQEVGDAPKNAPNQEENASKKAEK